MNWLLIVVSIFLIVCALNGYRLGFVKKLFTTVSFVITIIAASALTPYISDFLVNSTSIHDTIKESTIGVLEGDNFNESKEETVDAIKLPSIVKKMIKEDNGKESITNSIYEYIGNELADTIVNAMSFALAFIVITFVLRTTVFTLDIIANLPIIKGINQYAGLILGAAEGLVIVWILFLVITIIGNTQLGTMMTKYIDESQFLSFIYNYNFFFKLF
ncbi:CvpA family protein [Candidatus Galacturonibacter soehngenii]|uniref:CvpA family protein n=1 Tax=Candidatus Galacturonatibacter soehngenii TaxID=2307010 RepID=A0A7V7QJF1_9FIRM|nr:CvpA family protein [Candidatus Galacturonibacter soehngenii]KAB1436550.1 CvpA family protein [Candidatus Galacturonibacter soehngenii]